MSFSSTTTCAGALWIGTLEGLVRLKDGAFSRDEQLWFCTTKGLVVVDPNIKVNERPPPVFIEQVLADKKQVCAMVCGEPRGRGPGPPLTSADENGPGSA